MSTEPENTEDFEAITNEMDAWMMDSEASTTETEAPGAMGYLEEWLIANGMPCSLCGQSFSNLNKPKCTCLTTEMYNNNCYSIAICSKPPFNYMHHNEESSKFVYKWAYQNLPDGFKQIPMNYMDQCNGDRIVEELDGEEPVGPPLE
jgi:hypothetical protein